MRTPLQHELFVLSNNVELTLTLPHSVRGARQKSVKNVYGARVMSDEIREKEKTASGQNY